MYLDFYALAEKPFNVTPDPKFLLLTPDHREALAQLTYAVQESRGFAALTGEVGTGKTTLVQALRRRLDATTAVAYVFNSTLPFDELLEYILEDFGIGQVSGSRAQQLVALNHFLIERRRNGQNSVVIIDEAQNLDVATLEEIRLLSNFETSSEKLLQIILVGQPELRDKLNLPELRQLKQRVGLRCHISRLKPADVRDYMRTRLRIAGARNLGLFSDAAVTAIAEHSGGIPRVINIVCDHCLLMGYAQQRRRIDAGIAQEAIAYLEEGARPARRRWAARRALAWWPSRRLSLRWGVGAVIAAMVATIAMLAASTEAAYLYNLAIATTSFFRR